jgi:dTDP-4-dehydrorhamnose 3,5-epimerase-like enzyme
MDKPFIIDGGIAFDDRGSVSFANNFNFSNVKRFYSISNHKQGFVRAWHGHKREGKYFLAASGTFLIAAVEIDNWENPSKLLKVNKFVLSASKPSLLYVPPGYANGLMNLTTENKLMVFSTSALEDSLNDDIRFDSRTWDVWSIEER